MKKISAVILLIILITNQSYSQDAQYFDAPFGGGGGYTPGWYFPNLDKINVQLQGFNVPALSTKGFYTSGGAGFIYLGFIPQLRVGGMGFGGSTSSSANVNGEIREAIYSLGGGALTVEYTLPFFRDFGISIGASIGRGNLKIEVYKNSGAFDWNNVWTEISNSSTSNYSRTIENNYWIITPTLNVDIPFQRFVTFRIGAGYQFTFGDKWAAENDQPINNVPPDLTGKSFFIQSGVFIGFFSY
ncbi:MAG TPA: hypothetical protein VKA26_03205 [Ignavibacteriaceae bacterium]|nr:hypothetical protein [Ignavibacteriaceae bacterium]